MRKIPIMISIAVLIVITVIHAQAGTTEGSDTEKTVWCGGVEGAAPRIIEATIADIAARAPREVLIAGKSVVYKTGSAPIEYRAEPVSPLYFTSDTQCRKIRVTISAGEKVTNISDREACIGLDTLLIPPVKRVE